MTHFRPIFKIDPMNATDRLENWDSIERSTNIVGF